MLWYATVLFKNDNNENFKLTFFNTAITEINSFKKETTKLTEKDVTTNFLTLPSMITVTFNSKTKIVTKKMQSNNYEDLEICLLKLLAIETKKLICTNNNIFKLRLAHGLQFIITFFSCYNLEIVITHLSFNYSY